MSTISQTEFLKLWGREAVNQPGLPVETVALRDSPIKKPIVIMRKDAVA